jgi:hypothetical protein
MAEETLRRNLDSAFDPGPGFPHPSLLSRTMALVEVESVKPRDTRRTARPTWLVPAIAVVLAVLLVAGLVLAGQVMHSKLTVPVKPVLPLPHIPLTAGGATCFPYGPAFGNIGAPPPASPGPVIVKAVDPLTMWAKGGLLTTDGGAHWIDTSPAALREDAPEGTPRSYLPPDYVDFYVDAGDGWMARSYNYGSSIHCYDHVRVFRTSDGGRTWQQSDPIAVQTVPGSAGLGLRLFFINSRHGWLEVNTNPHQLYATDDAGRTWRLLSINQGCLNFISESEAWCRQLSLPGCETYCTAFGPIFFSQSYGVVHACDQYSGAEYLFDTHDGGNSWRLLPAMPPIGPIGACPSNVVFSDANDFWDVVAAPGTGRGSPTNAPPRNLLYHSADGGLTWTIVNRDMPGSSPVFADPDHGFLLQQDAEDPSGSPLDLLTTVDGGRSWHELEPQIS